MMGGYSSKSVRSLLWWCVALALALSFTAPAQARCSKRTYNGFVSSFEHSRDLIGSRPAQAYAQLVDLQKHASGCLQEEPNRSVRFKITLFQTGLQAYIGAADAANGNLPRGKSTAEAALRTAQDLLEQNQQNPDNKKLVEELITQLKHPLDLIASLEHAGG